MYWYCHSKNHGTLNMTKHCCYLDTMGYQAENNFALGTMLCKAIMLWELCFLRQLCYGYYVVELIPTIYEK